MTGLYQCRPFIFEQTEFKVGKSGFVKYVDHMGTDKDICDAARISYGKSSEDNYPKEKQEALINYLMKNNHTTPFEMCEVKLHIRVPMDTWRQWIRHRTANVNEYSTRYKLAISCAATTEPSDWRKQATDNKQGSSDEYISPTIGADLTNDENILHELSAKVYQTRLDKGVALEQARKDLPLSTYTEAYWKCDLHNIFNFLRLRMDSHAQKEIRDYAHIIGYEIIAKLYPLAWEAFSCYKLCAMTLSAKDIICIQYKTFSPELTKREKTELIDKCFALDIDTKDWSGQ